METWILVLLEIVNNNGQMVLDNPQILSFHDTKLECYETLGTYIADNAKDLIDTNLVVRCTEDTLP